MKGLLSQTGRRFIGVMEYLGGMAAWVMVAFVFSDAVLHKLFRKSITITWDASSLLYLTAISCVLPKIVATHGLVRVQIMEEKAGRRTKIVLVQTTTIASALVTFLVSWRGFVFARSLQLSNEVSNTAGIPLHPFAYLMSTCWFLTGVCLLLRFFKKKEG